LHALYETNQLAGDRYEIIHCGISESVRTAQGLQVGALAPLPQPRATDIIFVPGFPLRTSPPAALPSWLKQCDRIGARIFAICTGAFLLGRAGLLAGRRCTTHWRRTEELQTQFPKANVLTGRLFVHDGTITTSAGVASGIDMTLDFVEQEHGPIVAARVAREIVVYIRRDASHKQESIYTEHRTHIDPGVHAVQDWLIAHPDAKCGLAELAKVANMSERNLTRAFARATGIPIGEYRQRLRLEHARTLLANPSLTVEEVAARTGFADARQLRRLWRAAYGSSPRHARGSSIPQYDKVL
jgi:transcriptional regulator GlxA family with amidase domain